jgi:hypothetical protein
VSQHGLCATDAKFWKVIFAWYSTLAPRAISMRIAIDLVVCGSTAAEAETVQFRLDTGLSSIQDPFLEEIG